MIEIKITKEHIEEAEIKANDLGVLKNSVEKGKGNVLGFLGEIIVAEYYNWTIQNYYDYDIVHKNYKIDVKTKGRKVRPKEDYFATVFNYNTKQACDYYYFVSLHNQEKAYLMGIIKKEDFYKKATFNNQGDYDITSPPNIPFYFKAHCYNLKYSSLYPAEKIKINETANM